MSAALFDTRVWISPHACVCVCVYTFVSVCRYPRVRGCRCFVSLMRGVQGLHGGLVEDYLLLFCYESSSRRNRRNSLKWRRARLNNSAFTINFAPPLHRFISTPPLGPHGPAGSSWECWRFPIRRPLRAPVATREAVGAWVFVWVCNLVWWIIKHPPTPTPLTPHTHPPSTQMLFYFRVWACTFSFFLAGLKKIHVFILLCFFSLKLTVLFI